MLVLALSRLNSDFRNGIISIIIFELLGTCPCPTQVTFSRATHTHIAAFSPKSRAELKTNIDGCLDTLFKANCSDDPQSSCDPECDVSEDSSRKIVFQTWANDLFWNEIANTSGTHPGDLFSVAKHPLFSTLLSSQMLWCICASENGHLNEGRVYAPCVLRRVSGGAQPLAQECAGVKRSLHS